MSCICRGSTH